MIINADAVQWARDHEGELFHAFIADPPYHLTTITKRYGKDGSAPAIPYKDGAFKRLSTGFMGKVWDGGDIAFQKETWEAFYNILFPGAFGMAFGGSRTNHRMAVAIEDAGFIIHPQMSWVYGSGFPKATRIDTQIDKEAGAEREVIKKRTLNNNQFATSGAGKEQEQYRKFEENANITAPATDLAKQWEGHRYGLQALKPAAEPIIVFQKPYPEKGRTVDSITETGAGALNIDGGRIGTQDDRSRPPGKHSANTYDLSYREKASESHPSGRWPSTVVLTHSADCQVTGYRDSDSYQINRFTGGAKPFGDGAGHPFESEEVKGGRVPVWECVEGCPVLALDRQSGHLKSGLMTPDHNVNADWGYSGGRREKPTLQNTYADSGGASRFFHQSHWAIENADPFVYQAKVSVSERNAGLNSRQEESGGTYQFRQDGSLDGGIPKRRNPHPTLKPIALIEHLATLLLPPKEYAPRRVFVPFCGVASEVIGCWRAGWEEIIGIELEAEYAEIGRARLEYWKKQGIQLSLFEDAQ